MMSATARAAVAHGELQLALQNLNSTVALRNAPSPHRNGRPMPTAFVRSASALDTSVPRRAAVDEHRNAFADFGDDLRQRFDRRASRFRRPAAAIRFGDAAEVVRYCSC